MSTLQQDPNEKIVVNITKGADSLSSLFLNLVVRVDDDNYKLWKLEPIDRFSKPPTEDAFPGR